MPHNFVEWNWKERVVYGFILCVFAVAAVLAGVVTHWLLESPGDISTFIESYPSDLARNRKDTLYPGEKFYYVRKGILLTDAPREVHCGLYNDDLETPIVRLPPNSGVNQTIGEFNTLYPGVVIPLDAPPGRYSWRCKLYARINAIREPNKQDAQRVNLRVVPLPTTP